jgi:hypothetical protein
VYQSGNIEHEYFSKMLHLFQPFSLPVTSGSGPQSSSHFLFQRRTCQLFLVFGEVNGYTLKTFACRLFWQYTSQAAEEKISKPMRKPDPIL